MPCRQMFEVPDRKGIKSLSSELCDTEPTFQKVCVLPHSTLKDEEERTKQERNTQLELGTKSGFRYAFKGNVPASVCKFI